MNKKASAYEKRILRQRQEREERFKNSERGWLGLVGLFWLQEGENRIGSDKSNDIVLSSTAPSRIGIVQYNNGAATFHAEQGVPIYCNDRLITQKVLGADTHNEPDFLQIGDLSLLLLERDDHHLIRVWDKHSETRKNFTGFKQYPVNQEYCITAKYTPHKEPKVLHIKDVIEIQHEVPYQGYVTFEINGKEYRLEATADEDSLFFSFKDQTSGDTTYSGGRYLVTGLPENGKVVLDFNTAYNPPCAYTDYATCPLPPPGNCLQVCIEAGEKTYR